MRFKLTGIMYSAGFLSPLLHPSFIIVSQELTWSPNEWWGLGCQGFHSSSFFKLRDAGFAKLPFTWLIGSVLQEYLSFLHTDKHTLSTHDVFIVVFWAYLGAGDSLPLWAERILRCVAEESLFKGSFMLLKIHRVVLKKIIPMSLASFELNHGLQLIYGSIFYWPLLP